MIHIHILALPPAHPEIDRLASHNLRVLQQRTAVKMAGLSALLDAVIVFSTGRQSLKVWLCTVLGRLVFLIGTPQLSSFNCLWAFKPF